MEDTNKQKPLRSSTDKAKDLYNAYIKNEGSRSIPIQTPGKNKEENEMKDMEPKEEMVEVEIKEKDTTEEEVKDETPETPEVQMTEDEELLLDMQEKINQMDNEKQELKEQIVRITAEYDNYRKRTLKEKRELIEYGNEKLLVSMLDLLDDMTAAVDAGEKNQDYEALFTGLKMIHQKALKVFENNGVKPMEDPVGKEFDVDFHEALMAMPSDEPQNTIVQVVQNGYMVQEKVLRHAKVITSSGPAED